MSLDFWHEKSYIIYIVVYKLKLLIQYLKSDLGYFKDYFLTATKIVSYIVIGCTFYDSSEVLDIAYFVSNSSEIKQFSIQIIIECKGI